jgi:hypothetical protein
MSCRQKYAVLLAACLSLTCFGQQFNPDTSDKPVIVIPVLVRSKGVANPSPLNGKDFAVFEDNSPDVILGVEKGFQPTAKDTSTAGSDVYILLIVSPILLIVSPMSSSGLERAVHSAIKTLSLPRSAHWHVSVVTPSGTTLSFGKSNEDIIAFLKNYEKEVHAPQFLGGQWISVIDQDIQELGILPGIHAIVFVSDYESKFADINRNPWLLQVQPTMFMAQALRAHAPMYTVQIGGPSPVVPFGGAAESSQYSGTGAYTASVINNETASLGRLRSGLLYAADQTGGSPVNDIGEAFDRIQSDVAGYYVLRFEPKHLEADGTWHPISVRTTHTDLSVAAPHYYQAPISDEARNLDQEIQRGLSSPDVSQDLRLATRAWSFPDGRNGTYTMAFSVDARRDTQVPDQILQFVAELYSETQGALVGIWRQELPLESDSSKNRDIVFHWQNQAAVYPGVYTFRAVVVDGHMKPHASVRYRFIAHPFLNKTLLASDAVLSDGCFSDNNHVNLLSPVRLQSCNLELSPANTFHETSVVNVLLRLYATAKISDEIVKAGKAYAVISDKNGNDKQRVPLAITPDTIRGIILYKNFSLGDVHLSEGSYAIQIFLALPKLKGPAPLSPELEFAVTR